MLGRACQILLGAPKQMLSPSLTSIFLGEKSQKGDTDPNFVGKDRQISPF
jgi:hypothetical protein